MLRINPLVGLLVSLHVVALLPRSAQADGWRDLRVAQAKHRGGDQAGALTDWKRLARRGPGRVKAIANYHLARAWAAAGEGAKARTAYRAARRIAGVSSPAYRWVKVEVLLAEGKKQEALSVLAKLRSRFPKFRWARADILFSRLQEELSPPRDVAREALRLHSKSHLFLPSDELLARAARATETFDKPAGHRLWRRLIMQHPESTLVAQAHRRLPYDRMSDEDKLQRVEQLFARRAYEQCRAEALPLWKKGYRRDAVGFFLGKIGSERLRDDYVGAAKYLVPASTPTAPYALQALSSLGIVRAKRGNIDGALRAFDDWIQRYPKAPLKRRVEAHYDRAYSLHAAGRSRQASKDFGAFLSKHQRGFDWPKYWWFVAFWRYQAGDLRHALRQMKPLLKKRNSLVGGKARYWSARARWKLGEKKEAIAMARQLMIDMPLTWYSALARQRLEEWGATKRIPKRPDLSRTLPRTPAENRDAFGGLPMTRDLARLRMAIYLGEPDTARRVFAVVRKRLGRKLGAERLEQLAQDLSEPLQTIAKTRKAAWKAQRKVLRRYPTRRTVDAWRAIYPRAYASYVVPAAKAEGAPEWMVYAHMLQESRYNPFVVSNAPAYGLLELLDRTARRLAAEKKEPYQLWMLMEPGPNIRWGTRYLGALYRKFYGQLPWAIMSYNGGPMLLEWHLPRNKGRDLDLVIDNLSTHQARNYTRRVIEHFLRYLAIWERPKAAAKLRRQLIPTRWEPRFRKHPNY